MSVVRSRALTVAESVHRNDDRRLRIREYLDPVWSLDGLESIEPVMFAGGAAVTVDQG